MSYNVLEKAYNTLTAERQRSAEQFILFLVEQQEKENGSRIEKAAPDNFETVLGSFVGCTHVWDGTDVMEYQRTLRGEYRID